jgi:predicted transcriptional regulator
MLSPPPHPEDFFHDMTDVRHQLLTLTTDIVRAHVERNAVAANDISGLISSVYAALEKQGVSVAVEEIALVPAVSIKASIKPDYLVCLEDGKHHKLLKRHLATAHNLTPDAYRRKWDLPHDYPMLAPRYREQRSALAVQIGLGKRSSDEAAVAKTEALHAETAPVAVDVQSAVPKRPKAKPVIATPTTGPVAVSKLTKAKPAAAVAVSAPMSATAVPRAKRTKLKISVPS